MPPTAPDDASHVSGQVVDPSANGENAAEEAPVGECMLPVTSAFCNCKRLTVSDSNLQGHCEAPASSVQNRGHGTSASRDLEEDC
jgi:hypothetical protein